MIQRQSASFTILSCACAVFATWACSDGGTTPAVNGGGSSNSSGGSTSQAGSSSSSGGSAGSNAGIAGSAGVGGLPPGLGIGASCSLEQVCRAGLKCADSGKCEPGHSAAVGSACVVAQECVADAQCVASLCVPAGSSAQSESCKSDAECKSGLRCGLVGLNAQCLPEGAADVGATCASPSECLSGLACFNGRCSVLPAGTPGFVQGLPWGGVECEPPSTDTVRAYFEVPGAAGASEKDFFRLPFPNDARRSGGKLDLIGFPTPGAGFLGFDPVKLYVDAVSAESAWGAYPTVTFRFSGELEWDTFQYKQVDATTWIQPLRWVDVTPSAPEHGQGFPLGYFYSYGAGTYVCDHSISIRTAPGFPLIPGHTYAVFFTTDGKAKGKKDIERTENLKAILAATAPSDAKLLAVHTAYKPFRDYLLKEKFDVNNVLNATVFTVSDTRHLMTELAKAAVKETPTAKSWVKCGGGAKSPCSQAEGDRACGAENADYDEYHALVSLPIFQAGTAPYLTPADGGEIDLTSTRREDVCLALTVPKGTMPDAGWPLVVHAHGTGGSFRSHIRPEVAGALAKATPPTAVLGIDQVEHGPRRGASTESPNNLFFNFTNPRASRGNPLQGAADQLAVLKFAAALNLSAQQSGGAALKVDATKIAFFGHSQGSTEGSLMLPFADTTNIAMLSGNGATLTQALLTKTNPVNIAAALPIALQDPHWFELQIGAFHPVMTLLQQWVDPADPINFAALLRKPPAGTKPKHVFQSLGLGDTYSPPVTLREFIFAANLEQAPVDVSATKPEEFSDPFKPKPVALSANVLIGADKVTQGFRQYGPPAGRDGHFVVFDVAAANADMRSFLSKALAGSTPAIGQ